MAWIESDQALANHPKVRRLRLLLYPEVDRDDGTCLVIGRLHLLWWAALDYAPDGDLTRIADGEVADWMRWNRDPSELIHALLSSGFLDRTDDGRTVIHDWYERAGRLLEKRRQNAARQRAFRARHHHGTPTPPPGNGNTGRDGTSSVTHTSRATVPYQTKPNRTEEEDYQTCEEPASPSATSPSDDDELDVTFRRVAANLGCVGHVQAERSLFATLSKHRQRPDLAEQSAHCRAKYADVDLPPGKLASAFAKWMDNRAADDRRSSGASLPAPIPINRAENHPKLQDGALPKQPVEVYDLTQYPLLHRIGLDRWKSEDWQHVEAERFDEKLGILYLRPSPAMAGRSGPWEIAAEVDICLAAQSRGLEVGRVIWTAAAVQVAS